MGWKWYAGRVMEGSDGVGKNIERERCSGKE